MTEHNLEFLSLKRGCTCSSKYTLVKIPNCWKSHLMAHLYLDLTYSITSSGLVHIIGSHETRSIEGDLIDVG